MTEHIMRLFTDRFDPGARLDHALAAANRYIYLAEGMATLRSEGAAATLSANSGWCHRGAVDINAGADGAILLRWELHRLPAPESGVILQDGVSSRLTLDAEMTLDDPDGYLLRGDKVELPPGGIAYTHTHQGGGIRCLLVGEFHVDVEGETKIIKPYEAWFERGPDPVYAWAPDDKPGHFARVMILPRRLKGKSSISYVKPEDKDRPKKQKYTFFADEFMDI
jgi:quercetin dioxygenase-like cupin family protein